MDAQAILAALGQAAPAGRAEAGAAADQPTISVAREGLVAVCRALRDRAELRFQLLADITAVDWYPREPRFEVVYHLASLGVAGGRGAPPAQKRLRLKVRVPGGDPRVPSIVSVWPAAGWPEREVFDFFGIVFDGHPDLRRILMPEDWDGYPLRKDYPVQIRLSTKTQEPLQLSPEQFAANVRASRSGTSQGRTRAGGEPPEG
jgi:NADH-quinone oxidoreductase subunit C